MPDADFPHGPSSEVPASAGAQTLYRPWWQRLPWLLAGFAALALGVVGIVVPLLPTTPFVLLAAFCFARGSQRCERWLLTHPRFGPMVGDWRQHRAVPWRAKQLAWFMMAVGSLSAALSLPRLRWLPALCCLAVALWMWRLPTRWPDGTVSRQRPSKQRQ
ncbi:YbaN family protein [Roseateles sp. BYS180W]|uniref:YbaN family protein n=1 Tax=Roseateles rivi TaxID=3299028 RepID=A0ABW7FVK2_9BURK